MVDWFGSEFTAGWASEAAVAFAGHPIGCFVATQGAQLIGAACYNATFCGFFGPIGVREDLRGRKIGEALTIASLRAMREDGYAYGVIGAAKTPEFFARVVNATPIPDSWPGAYQGLLPQKSDQARPV